MKKRQEVYDLYWYFACERQNIFWKKINGESAPWTEDKILQEYKFCNSYRVNDRVSQYLLKNISALLLKIPAFVAGVFLSRIMYSIRQSHLSLASLKNHYKSGVIHDRNF